MPTKVVKTKGKKRSEKNWEFLFLSLISFVVALVTSLTWLRGMYIYQHCGWGRVYFTPIRLDQPNRWPLCQLKNGFTISTSLASKCVLVWYITTLCDTQEISLSLPFSPSISPMSHFKYSYVPKFWFWSLYYCQTLELVHMHFNFTYVGLSTLIIQLVNPNSLYL